MAITEALRLLIEFDGKGAIAGVKQFGSTAEKELKKAETGIDRVGNKLVKFGAGALTAGTVMAAGLYKAGQAASNLEQSVGGTESVFKEASATIDRFAKDSAQSVGLSERAFRELTTVTGASLKGMGYEVDAAADKSVQLVQIGADLAATFGGTTNDAVAALGATLRGEFDPAEKFGIALTAASVAAKAVEMGLATSTSKVDQNAKAQATLALIVERSADAQGQFGREADGAAGAQQRLKAELENFQAAMGSAVLPVLAEGASALGKLVQGFQGLPDPVQSLVSKIAVFGTGLVLATGAASTAVGAVIKLRNVFKDTEGQTSKLGSALGKVSIALAALAIVKTLHDINAETNKLKVSMDDLADDKKLTEFVKDVDGRLKSMNPQVQGISSSFKDWAEEIGNESVPMLIRFRDELKQQGHDVSDVNKIIDEKTKAEANAAIATDKEAQAVADAKTALEGETPVVRDLAAEQKELAAQLKETHDRQQELTDATLAAFDANLDYRQSVRDAHQALADYDQAAKDKKTSADDLQAAEDAVYRSYLDEAAAAATAMGAVDGSAESTRIQRQVLQDLANELDPGSPLRAQLQAYIDELGRLEGRIIQVEIRQRFTQSGIRAVSGDSTIERMQQVNGERAAGGPVQAGGVYWVGEKGPEPVVFGQSGQVLSHDDAMAAVGGRRSASGGNTYNITNVIAPGVDPVAVGRSTVEAIRAYERANGSSWRNN